MDMKKLQSFSDLENKLKQEKIPYKDRKEHIIENLNTTKNTASFITRKTMVICVSVLLFISITSVAIATNGFGLIPQNKEFIEAHKGEILTSIYDTSGNCVYEIGIIRRDNTKEQHNNMKEKLKIDNDFESVYKALEADLPDDKVALFIPVKGLQSTNNFYILNDTETYSSIKNMHSDGINLPSPKYLPDGFTLTETLVFYDYEKSKDLDKQNMIKLFNKTKSEGKDYFYKEYNRYDYRENYFITYHNKQGKTLQLMYKKGTGCSLYEPFNKKELSIKKSHYNGREYVLEGNSSYYSYFYISDELWTIDINAFSLAEDEVMKIIESMSY